MTSLIFLIACQQEPASWTPAEPWSEVEVQAPELVLSDLADPRGIAVVGDTLVIAEYGGGRVLTVDDGVVEELATELANPYMLDANEDYIVVSERGGGRVLALRGDTQTIVAEGLTTPGRIVLEGSEAWWLDEGTSSLWHADLEAETSEILRDGLDSPLGLDVADRLVYLAERGDLNRVITVDSETLAEEVVRAVAETPMDVVVGNLQAYFSARSFRWPYGGFIYGESGSGLCESPPGLQWLTVNDAHVYWSSNQSISRVALDKDTYELVVLQTAVGDLALGEDALFWTDRQRGQVLTVTTGP
ncbi:MAG: hypothetical protein HN348_23820 [Proteobacteria bacterium]|jgi:hypothetical protein|nr:hypothetical protein [Pseudomonadota bacterium]